jgi:hypothetical protein
MQADTTLLLSHGQDRSFGLRRRNRTTGHAVHSDFDVGQESDPHLLPGGSGAGELERPKLRSGNYRSALRPANRSMRLWLKSLSRPAQCSLVHQCLMFKSRSKNLLSRMNRL